jgi:transaldolase|tara:strand:+ start:1164 stop:1265 length:102 start_codon:yes stop_codon:yes gene_type:complete
MNEDPMATEKLAEGIRVFNQDQESLQQLVATIM